MNDTTVSPVITDLTDAQLRARGGLKWGRPAADVLPAWVAEIDVAPDPVVTRAVRDAVEKGDFGYPPPEGSTGLPEALASYASTQWGWSLDPAHVVFTGDVMSGIALALKTLCTNAPVVVPTPAYPPFLDVVPLVGRELVTIPLNPDAEVATLDLERIDDALRAGARTVLLCQPHNPWGRVFNETELTALLDIVTSHGARVISDDIHAGLVLPGATHLPFASLPGAAEVTTTILSASKAWNLPSLKCAQIVTGTAAEARMLRALPLTANHGVSTLGIAAAHAAYTGGQPWLDAWTARLGQIRDAVTDAITERLPEVRMRPIAATYLAWLDLRSSRIVGPGAAYQDDPARTILERGKLMVNDGRTFGPGGEGHIRVNLGTSMERAERIIDALVRALA